MPNVTQLFLYLLLWRKVITAIKSAGFFHASLGSLGGKAAGNVGDVGDAGPGSATASRGHCFLPPLSSSSSGSSQHGLQPASHPRGLPSSQAPHLPQKLLWEPCRPTRASHRHTLHHRGCSALPSPAPCAAETSCPHRCLPDLQTSKKAFTLLLTSAAPCASLAQVRATALEMTF